LIPTIVTTLFEVLPYMARAVPPIGVIVVAVVVAVFATVVVAVVVSVDVVTAVDVVVVVAEFESASR